MNPIENLQLLISAVEAHPEELFDLMKYKQEKNCGTLFCTLGLAASMPEFQEQGVQFLQYDNTFGFDVVINGVPATISHTIDSIFGPDAFDRLFQPAQLGQWDKSFGYSLSTEADEYSPNMTDKALALKRLYRQLSILEENNDTY